MNINRITKGVSLRLFLVIKDEKYSCSKLSRISDVSPAHAFKLFKLFYENGLIHIAKEKREKLIWLTSKGKDVQDAIINFQFALNKI